MTDAENPNIATLREAIRMLPREEVAYVIRELQDRANEALSALASTLAERDEVIGLLQTANESLCEDIAASNKRIRALEAPPAPAPGELAGPIDVVRLHAAEADLQDSPELAEQLRAVCDAAESWQRLQWRPASEAPCGMLLTTYEADGEQIFVIDEKHAEDDGWDERDDMALPIDALPALNGGDDNG